MGIAPHVAAWEELDGDWADEGSIVTLGPDSLDYPTVEIYVSGGWVDITPYVRWNEGISIRRGRSSEGSDTDVTSCSMTLDNRDGRFSPRNPLGPYYGQLKINTPLRVAVLRNGVTRYRFYGEVSEWPVRWHKSARDDVDERDVTVELAASGITRRLTQNTEPLRSAMYRNITRVDQERGSVVGYWPLEEPSGSVEFTSPLQNVDNVRIFGAAPNAQGFTEFLCSDGALTLTAGSISCVNPAYTPGTRQFMRVLMHAPDTAVSSTQTIFRVTTSGSARYWTVQVDTSFNVRLLVQDPDEAVLYSSGFVDVGAIEGRQSVLLLILDTNGSDIDVEMRFADLETPNAWTPFSLDVNTISTTVAGQSAGYIFRTQFGNNFGLDGWSFAHVTVVNDLTIYGELVGSGSSALVAYAGENPSDRMRRLCAEEGIPLQVISKNQTGNTVTMGAQGVKPFMDLIRECANTDGGILFEPRDQLALGYRSRLSLYNQAAALTLDYTNSDLGDAPVPVDDDRHLINDVEATNDSPQTARARAQAVQETGPRNVQDPSVDPEGVGRYRGTVTVSITTHATNGILNEGGTSTLDDQAHWALHLGTWDEERYPSVQLDLHRSAIRDSVEVTNQILALEQGDRYDITNMPEWTAPGDVRQMLQGYEEFIGGSTLHTIWLQGTPIRPWTVAYTDSSFGGFFFRADTDGSVLTSDIDSTQTSFSVTVTGDTLWTTDASQGSIGLMVAGEQMLATAISGASSPQTFTVSRSQNGIVKAHAAGTEVRLFQQSTVQL